MEKIKIPERCILKNFLAKNPENSKRVTRPTKYKNKFKLIEHGGEYTRERSLQLYEVWLDEQLELDPAFLDDLLNLDYLCCFCRKRPSDFEGKWWCHAEIIIDRIKKIKEQRKIE